MTFLMHILLALSDREPRDHVVRRLRERVAELEAENRELRAYKRATAGGLWRASGKVEA